MTTTFAALGVASLTIIFFSSSGSLEYFSNSVSFARALLRRLTVDRWEGILVEKS